MPEKDERHRTHKLDERVVWRLAWYRLVRPCKAMNLLVLRTATGLLVTETGRSKLGLLAQYAMARLGWHTLWTGQFVVTCQSVVPALQCAVNLGTGVSLSPAKVAP